MYPPVFSRRADTWIRPAKVAWKSQNDIDYHSKI